MRITERAEGASKAIFALLQVSPTNEQAAEVRQIVEEAVIHGMLEQSERCSHAAVECCGHDVDTAHKVAAQIRRSYSALVANLSSMR